MRGLMILAAIAIPAAAGAQSVQPGLWAWSSKITSMSGPKLPPSVVATMLRQPPTTDKQCLRPAEASQGFLNMLKKKSPDCAIKSSSYAGGVVDIQTVCRQSGKPTAMHFRGPFSATAFSLTADTATSDMKMSMIFSAKRIGSCG